jgi:hypothetical protein
MKRTKSGQQKKPGEKPLRNALKMATVVASLGASLGVNVDSLLAADLSATDPCGDLTQISISEGEIMTQGKILLDQQNSLLYQLRQYVANGTVVPLSKVTAIRDNSNNLASQFKLNNDKDYPLRVRFNTDQANISARITAVQNRQSTLTTQLRTFQENQAALINLLNSLKIDQAK